MLLALVVAQSLLVRPLHLTDAPPPLAAARRIVLEHAGADGSTSGRTREEALEVARRLIARVRAGDEFGRLAEQFSSAPEAQGGGELGSFVPGALAPEIDAFLFSAHDGDVSEPIALASGVALIQRVEAHAAVLRIQVTGEGERRAQRADLVTKRLKAGEDFALVARELSDDRESAARGGQFAIYERSANDKLLKRLAFDARIGAVVGPLEVPPLGLNWLKRVPLADVDPKLAENGFQRLRAILFQHENVPGASPNAPTELGAKGKADRALERLEKGESFRVLAREMTDDPGGREREGDLGWVHRATPGLPGAVCTAFLLAIGQHTPVLRCDAGWVILERER